MTKILAIALSLFYNSSDAPRSEGQEATPHSACVAALACPPPGTCAKASVYCRKGWEQPWCDILERCEACLAYTE